MNVKPQMPGEDQPAGEGTPATAPSSGPKWPKQRYAPTRGQGVVGNFVMKSIALWGLIPHAYVLTTKGRKTGRLHSIPVALVEEDDKKWLVAPYGPVPWVLNARAAGKVTLSRGGKTHMYTIEELPPLAAGPVLKLYLAFASATKPYFEATKESPVGDFVKEASRHPVFALTRTTV